MIRFLCMLFLVGITVLTLPGQNISEYLQLDLEFTGGSVLDASPNATVGAGYDLSSAVGIEGALSGAVRFNGTSSYIDMGTTSRNITDQLTVSAWVRTTALDTDRQTIVAKYDVNDDAGFVLSIVNGKATFGGRNGSNTLYQLDSDQLLVNDGDWHHLVGVVNGNSWQLYVDCQLVGELTSAAPSPAYEVTDPLTIGRLSVMTNDGFFRYFEGTIDNVKLYDRALTEDEISDISLYTCPVPGVPLTRSILKRLVGAEALEGYSVLDLADHELLLLGSAKISESVTSALIIRCTEAGEIIWSKSLEATGMESPVNAIQTADGGFAIVGLTTSGGLGDVDVLVVKMNSDGTLVWSKVYGGSAEDRGFGIYEVDSDHLLIAGSTRSYGAGQRDAFLFKIESDGDLVWAKTYGGSNGNDIFLNGWQVSDTEFIFNGLTLSYGQGFHDLWLLRVDEEGDFISGNAYGNSQDENPIVIRRTNSGDYIVAGHSNSTGLGDYDGLVMKLSASGVILWAKAFGGNQLDKVRGMIIDKNQTIVVEGVTQSAGAGNQDLFLLEIDMDGNLISSRTYGTAGDEELNQIGLEPLLELSNNRLFNLGTTKNGASSDILFANYYRPEEDICIGADWSLSFVNANIIREAVTPGTGEPAIAVEDLNLAVSDYNLTMDFFTSDHCPVDLEITENSTPCSYQASNDLWTMGSVEIEGDITFRAGNNISLQPGFRVAAGATFTAQIEDCSSSPEASMVREATPVSEWEAPVNELLISDKLKVFPNPATDYFTVQFDLDQPTRVYLSLIDASGREVRQLLTGTPMEAGSYMQEFSSIRLPGGMYWLRYRSELEVKSTRLMIVENGR